MLLHRSLKQGCLTSPIARLPAASQSASGRARLAQPSHAIVGQPLKRRWRSERGGVARANLSRQNAGPLLTAAVLAIDRQVSVAGFRLMPNRPIRISSTQRAARRKSFVWPLQDLFRQQPNDLVLSLANRNGTIFRFLSRMARAQKVLQFAAPFRPHTGTSTRQTTILFLRDLLELSFPLRFGRHHRLL